MGTARISIAAWIVWATQSAFAQYGLPATLQAELPFGTDLTFSVAQKQLTPSTLLGNAVYVPPGDAAKKRPALIIHHTCGGISDHIFQWGEAALREGYAVLMLDTLTPRGLKADCGSPSRIPNGRWVKDQLDSIAYLAAQPFVNPKAISTLGFSKGGLASTWLSSPSIAQALRPGTEQPAATVALYALCALAPSKGRPQGIMILQQDTSRPLLMLLGEKDNELPPQSCIKELPLRKASGSPVEWHVYPNTTHAWDKAEQDGFTKPSPINGEVVEYRHNKDATEDARKRVFEFLKRHSDGS